jgi:hypothetical protein
MALYKLNNVLHYNPQPMLSGKIYCRSKIVFRQKINRLTTFLLNKTLQSKLIITQIAPIIIKKKLNEENRPAKD